jgi:kynurenine formamidase
MRILNVIALLSCLLPAHAVAVTGETIVDLTYSFSSDSVYWPTAEGFKLQVDSEGMTEKGYYYKANSFEAAEHGGTHLDAPIHFSEGSPSVDEIDLRRLVAPGVMIDVSDRTAGDADYLISIADIKNWEAANGKIPEGNILLFRTGWGKFYLDKKRYMGTDQSGPEAVKALHFPGLDPDAAKWLVENRSIGAVGLDTASIDRGQSQYFRAHQIFFAAGIPALENVANLDLLPVKGFQIVALPMKIKSGSGAPLRIIAILH